MSLVTATVSENQLPLPFVQPRHRRYPPQSKTNTLRRFFSHSHLNGFRNGLSRSGDRRPAWFEKLDAILLVHCPALPQRFVDFLPQDLASCFSKAIPCAGLGCVSSHTVN